MADRLASKRAVLVDHYNQLVDRHMLGGNMQDIVSYTSLSQQCEPEDIMNMLHR
jgi:hypothetical protein